MVESVYFNGFVISLYRNISLIVYIMVISDCNCNDNGFTRPLNFHGTLVGYPLYIEGLPMVPLRHNKTVDMKNTKWEHIIFDIFCAESMYNRQICAESSLDK